MKAAFFVAKWLILGALAVVSAPAIAKKERKAGQPSAARPSMSRDMVFDGSTISGRYLSAGEATATVEQEKKMNELIGSRADFNDRLRASQKSMQRSNR